MIVATSDTNLTEDTRMVLAVHDQGIGVGEMKKSGKWDATVYAPQAVADFARDMLELALEKGAE